MHYTRRSLTTLSVILATIVGTGTATSHPAVATASSVSVTAVSTQNQSGELPSRWEWSADRSRLTWTAPRPVPVMDAKIDVRADGEILPGARVSRNGRKVSVPVSSTIADVSSLEVVAAGRRLDRELVSSAPRRSSAKVTPKSSAGSRSLALPAADDPGRSGPYRTTKGEYQLDPLHLDGWSTAIEMQALVVEPVDAPGHRPVALFLHGRQATCYNPDADPDTNDSYQKSLAWPCASGWSPFPSYRGYRQTQQLLASQGWITVSIGANGITAEDNEHSDFGTSARSKLIEAHLARWAAWSASKSAWSAAPAVVRSGPRPDLKKTLLVGHSRGGEGVNQASIDSATLPSLPWQVRGQVLIAPTNGQSTSAPGVPTAVLLGSCDGDISDLQGQGYIDESRDITVDPALRSAVYIKGANHNYFNAEWTPGLAEGPAQDDWSDYNPMTDSTTPDPDCSAQSPSRLNAAEQRAVGATYTAAAAQALVLQRNAVVPLLDGTGTRAASAGRAEVLSPALGGHRTPVLVPAADTTLTTDGSVAANRCITTAYVENACVTDDGKGYSPHFREEIFRVRQRTALALQWDATGGKVRATTGVSTIDASATALALRIAVPARSRDTRFAVALIDGSGHEASLGTVAVNGLSGDPATRASFSLAQELRLPLDRAVLSRSGLKLTDIASLEITPVSGTGELTLLDVWSYRAGLDTAAPVTVPRFDLPTSLTVDEGDTDHAISIPMTITGRVEKPARVHFLMLGNILPQPVVADLIIAPGTTHAEVQVPIHGNTIANVQTNYLQIEAISLSNIVEGAPSTRVPVRDDDPVPTVSITPTTTAVEGAPLTWTLTLSAPVDDFVAAEVVFVAPTDGSAELQIVDLPADWVVRGLGYYGEQPETPLSQADVNQFFMIQPGETSATIELPTILDNESEGTESVRLQVLDRPYMISIPQPLFATGTVTDN
jgi:hypothetical protein